MKKQTIYLPLPHDDLPKDPIINQSIGHVATTKACRNAAQSLFNCVFQDKPDKCIKHEIRSLFLNENRGYCMCKGEGRFIELSVLEEYGRLREAREKAFQDLIDKKITQEQYNIIHENEQKYFEKYIICTEI